MMPMFILFTLISKDFGAPIQEFMLHSMQSYCDVVNTELQCQYSGPGLYILDNTHVDILSMDRFFRPSVLMLTEEIKVFIKDGEKDWGCKNIIGASSITINEMLCESGLNTARGTNTDKTTAGRSTDTTTVGKAPTKP
ncbi:Hypothetical predicted protein [Mytilus galloprovincialis]|uniref:Uncharacterized protein n=1 Tax=Mytilus galloprovincialis TaxID=29158 RepID=A0A8B6G173_MYTGA|nr:Hypothetical predicted protein [Mytilus galloprovincialis]